MGLLPQKFQVMSIPGETQETLAGQFAIDNGGEGLATFLFKAPSFGR